MITRIVRLSIREDQEMVFLNYFREREAAIGNFPGCKVVRIFRDRTGPSVFFTISEWENENALEQYRSSDLFKETWTFVKSLFKDPPIAYSLQKLDLGPITC